ncbi:xanthine dehydrogenase subunit XdhB [Lacrimispora sp. 210928-DFI.3.58]|uniref:xanthine dehydrogenase subunit XdhB n=1 Tax=Lacrimispora sp. 210928-DFI.3.58 TaxID=2883214 RepID=UPI0015B48BAE|nr:xanthine dehydrogenase subunit XdhB [Lacrimispora sp. 210928-DFI.3.58]MCB7320493.1 xanthine dehydrogenase FAD-binding subunit XdhB [Lacrimispora sp. 210928-DFI.3.58]
MFDIRSFYEAKSVEDAVDALVRDENAEIISGGTDVLIRVREGRDAGRSLVSIHNIKELKGVRLLENGDLSIGAGTSFSHITNDPLIQKYIPMLGEAVDTVGGPQIRNTGTIGGNICNGATSADSASTMCTLDADILLEGPEGRRIVPIASFYTGPGRTVRERTEVCTCFLIHRESYEGWHGHYIKYGKRKAMEIATLGCAVRVKLSEDKRTIEDVRLGYGVAGPTPLRCKKAEELLRGCLVTDQEAVGEFARMAVTEVNPRSSWRASKEFRLQLIEELPKRALAEAVKKAGGIINA